MSAGDWPSQLLVERSLDEAALEDVAGAVEAGLASALGDVRWKGDRIAVAAGSRGIDRIPEVVAAVVKFVRSRGGAPFVMPAMGSHGGATGEGQAAILSALGIDEAVVGAPIVSSIEVVDMGPTPDGLRVLAARDAVEAAGIVLVNRIKPHTDFMGPFGSGLQKMAAIGLGKVEGAFACHKAAA
ncbi:MAG TPA: lactate racemase domain-containing protein, partial [Vicinamibacteria bacterium]